MISALLALLAFAFAYLAYRYLNRSLTLGGVPPTSVRAAHQGYVHLVGRAVPLQAIPPYAPVVEQRCVWFDYHWIEGDGDSATRHHRRTTQSFLLDDGTGSCRIDPRGIGFETRNRRSGWFNRVLSTRGLVSLRWIAVDETIHVYGNFDTLFRDFGAERARLRRESIAALKQDTAALGRADADGDGAIDADEWRRAVESIDAAADEQIFAAQKEMLDQPPVHVLRPPAAAGLPYLVSSRERPAVVGRYRWLSLLFAALALACAGASLNPDAAAWLEAVLARGMAPPR